VLLQFRLVTPLQPVQEQVVSESGAVSDVVDVTNWKHGDWDRGNGIEDPGSIYSGSLPVPSGFGTPGASCLLLLAGHAPTHALHALSCHACRAAVNLLKPLTTDYVMQACCW
jgi:hypothetical protein